MEDFIRPYAEKLQQFKKTVFQLKHAQDFLQKLCERGEIVKMEAELTKCLLNNQSNRESEERRNFIFNFVEAFRKFSETNIIKSSDKEIKQQEKIDISSGWGTKPSKGIVSKDDWQKKFKVTNKEEEFPTIENIELVKRKKNFEVLDHHYSHKLEKGIKICFCMGTKHPLIGNCLNCGRIQCLQEGDKECIVCGNEMLRKEEYLKLCAEDKEMKKSFNHKEKLLKFQADFYSKLQIIDDFSDWYEISNNTWVSKENRELAKKKDEEIDRIRDDPEFEYNINFKTMEISKVYEQNDDNKMKEDVTNFFIDSIRNQKDKSEKLKKNITQDCRAITEKAIMDFNNLSKKNKETGMSENYEQNIKKLSKRIDLDLNEKIGEEMEKYNKNILFNIELMNENDNFIEDTDIGMCLSMHQPWASLVIEGFKRFEGREWDSEYRGILWIHSTSKKPDQDLIDLVEGECKELYKNCKKMPKFPKRYPLSSLLGCIDLVDILKKESYTKIIPNNFREKTESKFLFVCKNPKKLEIPIKMPGQPNLYKLGEEIMERTRGKLMKTNTFWWPAQNINVILTDIPFINLLKADDNTNKTNTKHKKIATNKIKINNNVFAGFEQNSIILLQNFINRERKETILNLIDAFKKEMSFHSDYLQEPYLHYGLHINFQNNSDMPLLLQEMFKEIQSFFREEKKLNIELNLSDLEVEYIDWYGVQNFRENLKKSIKLVIGNPLIFSILNDSSDINGNSIKLECGDIFYLSDDILYSVSQVLYDSTPNRISKNKQGSVIITFKC